MAQQIPLHTLLGDRYKVTARVLETADGDTILDGVDQILNRKVSIVVASAEHSSQLVANARQSTSLSRSSVQILDLGNIEAQTYLVTSHARADTLLSTLLTEGGGEAEEFGEEIFGDTGNQIHFAVGYRSKCDHRRTELIFQIINHNPQRFGLNAVQFL